MSLDLTKIFMDRPLACVFCGKVGHLVLMRSSHKDQAFMQRWDCEICNKSIWVKFALVGVSDYQQDDTSDSTVER